MIHFNQKSMFTVLIKYAIKNWTTWLVAGSLFSLAFVWMFISLRFTPMQALHVLSVCKWSIKYSIVIAMWEKERIFNLLLQFTPQVKCDYAPTPQSGSQTLLKCSWRESDCTDSPSQINEDCYSPRGPPPLQRGIKTRARPGEGSREGGFEDQCTYVEWHPKLWYVSQHERGETEGFQVRSPLSCSGKSLCSGGYLRVV